MAHGLRVRWVMVHGGGVGSGSRLCGGQVAHGPWE